MQNCIYFLYQLKKKTNSTYKQYHMTFVFIWLISLSMIISRFIQVAANGITSFFYVTSSISLSMYTASFLSITLSMDICLHVLIIVSSAAMNIWVHVSTLLEAWFSPDVCPGVVLENHVLALCF